MQVAPASNAVGMRPRLRSVRRYRAFSGPCLGLSLSLAIVLVASHAALGQTVQFQVNSTLSTINLTPATFSGFLVASGTKLTSTVGVVQQRPQSLNAKLSGVLVGTISGGVFSLDSQSLVVALENPVGPFIPDSTGVVDVFGGLAVSNFGGVMETESTIAVRDVTARLLGGAIAVGAPANTLSIEAAGVLDILDFDGFGYSESLTDLLDPASNTSSQPVTGNLANTITIPYSLDYIFDNFSVGDGRVSLTGTVVATRVTTTIPGDFDGNTIVNSADLTRWRGAFGVNGTADADGDGDSDGADFLAWQRNLGRSAVIAAETIPEPSAAWMACFAVAAAASHSGRRREIGRASPRAG